LSTSAQQKYTAGEITNLLTNDTDTALEWFQSVTTSLSTILSIIFGAVVLYTQLSWASLLGILFMAATGPVQVNLGSKVKNWMKDWGEKKGTRLRFMNEILGGMKVIKLYVLENHFIKKVSCPRVFSVFIGGICANQI
jgi:ABC-type multidrug transport system fused ATPase/permease subunit